MTSETEKQAAVIELIGVSKTFGEVRSLSQVDFAVYPGEIVGLRGEKQGVAITRALYFDAQLVILDEPTMGLSLSETNKTLEFVKGIKAAGKSAIFIDHNVFHVYPVVDRLYVLDRGRMAGVYKKAE